MKLTIHLTILRKNFLTVLCSLIFVVSPYIGYSQLGLIGITKSGGQEFGTIFKTDMKGDQLSVVHEFEGNSGSYPYFSTLVEVDSGLLYGLSSQGGLYGNGVLYVYNTVSKSYTKLFDFDGANSGAIPKGSLTLASNGKLYGFCSQGGANNLGVIFEFDPSDNSMNIVLHFDGSNGRSPNGKLTEANNGLLYGLTYQGGSNNEGVLFTFDPSNGTYTKKIDLDGTINGRNPFGSLMQASDGKLYGMCYQGGNSNFGILFEYNTVNDSLKIRMHFDGSNSGANPYGDLYEYGNGILYGLTFLGGSINAGVAFTYDINNNSYTKIADMLGTSNGRNPYGNFIAGNNGNLYALTYSGGTSNAGVILEYDPINDTLINKLNLGASGNQARNPFGSFYAATNGLFYAISYRGGLIQNGILFSYDYSNNVFNKEIEFNNAPNGSNSFGSLFQASNYKLYGMTYSGGTSNLGVLFEFDAETNTYTKKVDFDGINKGRLPYSSLIEYNGLLYGLTFSGGVNNAGVLFTFDPSNSNYTKVIDLDGTLHGSNPLTGLTLADNGLMYGMTSFGGLHDYGCIFSFNPSNSTISKIIDFDDSTNGSSPYGNLIQINNGNLFGMTFQGGSNGYGILFSYNPSNSVFTKHIEFDGITNGANPVGSLTEASNGNLYGMTQNGGNDNLGLIFEYDPIADIYTVISSFDSVNGAKPSSKLMQTKSGKMYGMTQYGGSNNTGIVFEFDPGTYNFRKTADLDASTGQNPQGNLISFCFPTYSNISVSTCDSFIAPSGKYIYKNSGTYSDTIESFIGCDSIIEIDLRIKTKSSSFLSVSACNTYTAPDLQDYDSSGTYTAIIPNAAGCDSVITFTLKILNSKSNLKITQCNSYTGPDSKIYDGSGIYTIIIPNIAGCDSTITLDLKILNSYTQMQINSCRSYTGPDNQTYDSSGTYTSILSNYLGCDSIITILLNIIKPNVSVTVNDPILRANADNVSYQWFDCSNNFSTIQNGNQKQFTPSKNGQYAVEINDQQCKDTSICYTISSLSINSSNFESAFKFYPNPTNERITIEFSDQQTDITLNVYDVNGRLLDTVHYQNTDSILYDLNAENGTYFIELSSGNQVAVIRVLKL